MFGIIQTEKTSVAKIILLSLAAYVLVSLPPVVLGRWVDLSMAAGRLDLRVFVGVLVLAMAALGVERILSRALNAFSGRLIVRQYMHSVKEILERERLLFREVKIGEIIDVFSRYISSFEDVAVGLIGNLVPSLIAMLVIGAVIAIVSKVLILATLVGIQVALLIPSTWLILRYSKVLDRYTKANYRLSDEWVELLGNTRIIQSEYSFERALRRLNAKVGEMADRYIDKAQAQDLVRSFVGFSQILALLCIVGALLFYLQAKATTTGAVLSVIALNTIFHSHLRTVSEFVIKVRNFQNYKRDFERITSYRSYPVISGAGADRFEYIVIRKKDLIRGDKTIFSLDSDFSVRAGERILILGLSGAGKTSFLSFFFNAFKEHAGDVFLNGSPLSEVRSEDYQKLVRLSFQENELLSGAGHDQYFQRDVDSGRAQALLTALRLPDDIASGERALEPWAGNISGGEAKRMNIARLLVEPGELNILDEPTTGLNVSLTKHTWDTLFERLDGKAVICASHDLSCLSRFERVLIIDEGRIAADLPPAELEGNPHFAKIRDRL